MEGRTFVITDADSGIRCHDDHEKYRVKQKARPPQRKSGRRRILQQISFKSAQRGKNMRLFVCACVCVCVSVSQQKQFTTYTSNHFKGLKTAQLNCNSLIIFHCKFQRWKHLISHCQHSSGVQGKKGRCTIRAQIGKSRPHR